MRCQALKLLILEGVQIVQPFHSRPTLKRRVYFTGAAPRLWHKANYACACGQRFISTYQLRLHKKADKHTCKRKQKNSPHSTAKRPCMHSTVTKIIASAGATKEQLSDEEDNSASNRHHAPTMQSKESEKCDSEESELCMVCGKGEDDDDTVETRVLCEQCNY